MENDTAGGNMMAFIDPIQDPARWIETAIKDFVNRSPENSLKDKGNQKAWEEPLVGFSSGADPLYQEFKDHLGAYYWTPIEIFTKTFPQLKVTPEQLTIICWILPKTEATKLDNRKETLYASERWARARKFGGEFMNQLYDHVVLLLNNSGYAAVAPYRSSLYEKKTATYESVVYNYSSAWSERHAAYASGLGTFGLCEGLITPKGKAVRCASVVAHIQMPPSKRPYDDRHAYCLFYTRGNCTGCIQRCPAGAITEEGHHKGKCYIHMHTVVADHTKSHFGFESFGCGLCQTGVPCESGIPK